MDKKLREIANLRVDILWATSKEETWSRSTNSRQPFDANEMLYYFKIPEKKTTKYQ